jgi:hypothetical protein
MDLWDENSKRTVVGVLENYLGFFRSLLLVHPKQYRLF